MILYLAAACATPILPAPAKTSVEAKSPADYADARDRLERRRMALAARWASDRDHAAIRAEARGEVLSGITEELIPRWAGTPWDFYGTTETPGQGEIACGYFVSTILRDAGFRVERARLAQQAAEHIELTFVPKSALHRFRDRTKSAVDRVVDDVSHEGSGLYLVGLDNHVGFLWNDGSSVEMCHASWLAGGVVCEDARTSAAMPSKYTVTAKLLGDSMIEAWLEGRPFATAGS